MRHCKRDELYSLNTADISIRTCMYETSMKPYECIVFRSMDPQSLGGTPFRMKCTYYTNLCDTYNDNVGVLITMLPAKDI